MGLLLSIPSSVSAAMRQATSSPEGPLLDPPRYGAPEPEPWRWPLFLLLGAAAAAAAAAVWWSRRRRRRGRDFYAQVQTFGKTGGCEEQFLKDVSKCLSQRGVSLKLVEFTKTSKHLLFLFCPIASRMGTDLQNALEGLRSEQRAILVVMHYLPVGNQDAFVDTRQVPHPALVQTVHVRYTLPDGIYPCKFNVAAVNDVVAAIKALPKDR